MQTIIQSLKTIVLAVIIGLGVAYVFAAWTGPTAVPPNENAPAPINIGPISQYKEGALGVGGVVYGYGDPVSAIFDKNVGIGTGVNPPTEKLDVNGNVRTNDVYLSKIGKWASELGGGEESGLLVNGVHSTTDCKSKGGLVIEDGSGNKMCRFGASCPAGWVHYNNWSVTQPNSGTYKNEVVTGNYKHVGSNCQEQSQSCSLSTAVCTTDSHSWSNVAQETKTCKGKHNDFKRGWCASCPGPVLSDCSDWRTDTYNCTCDEGDWWCSEPIDATDVTVNATITEMGCY